MWGHVQVKRRAERALGQAEAALARSRAPRYLVTTDPSHGLQGDPRPTYEWQEKGLSLSHIQFRASPHTHHNDRTHAEHRDPAPPPPHPPKQKK
jgi:hypothetical protein